MNTPERTHTLRLAIAWAVLSVIGVVVAMQINMPPGHQTQQAADESSLLSLMLILSTPVCIGVVLFILYSVFAFRRVPGSLDDGPSRRGNLRMQWAWTIVTALIVFTLAGIGINGLANSSNASTFSSSGGSLGTQTVGTSASDRLQVQVIAQQWYFTYRYPGYGGAESTHLVLPVNANIEFHVTSTDVIHSFWAYELGVKADANPGTDNITYATTTSTGSFTVRCAELCGIWHGNMFDTQGKVVSQGDFATWVADLQSSETGITLPPYAPEYFPSPRVKGT
ncbi:MAG TPA: cytochrome c oxidase subunit II [Candidatus Baltobacterales bacterium]|nr:cytochrome c oxidase subunit II [Candidatus Baltobacterales bacterium]